MELHLLNLCFALHFAHQRKDVKGLANFFSYFLFVYDQKNMFEKIEICNIEVEKNVRPKIRPRQFKPFSLILQF